MYHGKNNFDRRIFNNTNKKKKFFIYLIILLIIIFALIKFITKSKSNNDDYYNNTVFGTILKNQNKSIFNVKELNAKELKDRIILLNAYNINDFSYIFSIDLANKLEKQFKNKIVVIDVIMDDIELDNNTIINYIIKNNIERPVMNISDLDIDNSLENKNKYFVLIDNKGIIVDTFTDENINQTNIENAINNLLAKNPKLNTDKLSFIMLEKTKNPESFIKSLEHIEYLGKIDSTNDGPYFIISDTKGRKIYFLTINGNIVNQLGNGINGDSDGSGTNATFCSPAGMAIENGKTLYIADTCNNSIRKVDLNTMEVSTLVSNNDLLKRPTDIEILNDNLIISAISDNQILKYNLKNNELSQINCDSCSKYILKLAKFNKKIYFLEESGLNSLDENDKINKEIDFNNLKGGENIKLNINNNFHVDDTGVYIADKFENKIIRIKDDKITEYSSNNGKKIYNLPTDIIDFKDKLYITNENDKKLIQLDKNTKDTKIINITFGYEYNKIKGQEDQFLNINNLKELSIKNGSGNKIYLNLENGYSFEKMAPQSLAIYKEDIENSAAVLIKNYSKTEILENSILDMPTLDNESTYYIRGNFYYCNFDKKTPCLINKYDRKIITNEESTNNRVVVDFLYQ